MKQEVKHPLDGGIEIYKLIAYLLTEEHWILPEEQIRFLELLQKEEEL